MEVLYFIYGKKIDPIEAVGFNWNLARGHGWNIFFRGVTSFLYLDF
jgi:hypothetical protein